ncbi:hypothetical protein BaRGS_00020384 [Batillaria attramentaria]|uniref:Amidase n=1 Tax=Batillaria attramentaria TaxID=370345 RepID=A0ABD0KNE9_9CAEN
MPFNSTGHPALAINAGFAPTNDGKQLPVGMMIVGRKFDDVTVLQVIAGYEDGRDPRQFPNMAVTEYT